MKGDPGVTIVAAFAVFAVVLVVGGFWMSRWSRRKRAEGLEQAAQGMGWRYEMSPGPVATVLPGAEALPLLQRGHVRSRSVEHLLRDRNPDRPARLFDYQYTTGNGDDRHTRRQTIAAFDLGDSVNLPAFTLAPETFWDRIADRFGFADIDFDSYPEFSAHYKLKGPDEDAIRRFFRDTLLLFFEAHQGLNVEASGRWLIVYRHAHKVHADEMTAWRDETAEVARAIEREVTRR